MSMLKLGCLKFNESFVVLSSINGSVLQTVGTLRFTERQRDGNVLRQRVN